MDCGKKTMNLEIAQEKNLSSKVELNQIGEL